MNSITLYAFVTVGWIVIAVYTVIAIVAVLLASGDE
jgi:hypothetical protein